jgi:hypothetical protein
MSRTLNEIFGILAISDLVQDPAAWGAFLTGVGSVLAATFSLKRAKRAADSTCEQRIKEIEMAFTRGTRFERRAEERGRKRAGES